MHLTVISYPSTLDREIENAVPRIDAADPKVPRRIARCQKPTQLIQRVREAGGGVRRLDLFGHGRPGAIILGDEKDPLITEDPKTWVSLTAMANGDFLTKDAEIRLLGCQTGIDEVGYLVLRELSKALRRPVWGSRARIDWSDFGPNGFDPRFEELLVSSAAMRGKVGALPRPGERAALEPVELLSLGLHIPPGYQYEGYANIPAGIVDSYMAGKSPSGAKVAVTILCVRRYVAVTTPSGHHILLHWLAEEHAPALKQLTEYFTLH